MTMTMTMTIAKTIPETYDVWDTNYNSDNWEPEFMTTFFAWQLWHWTAFATLAIFYYHDSSYRSVIDPYGTSGPPQPFGDDQLVVVCSSPLSWSDSCEQTARQKRIQLNRNNHSHLVITSWWSFVHHHYPASFIKRPFIIWKLIVICSRSCANRGA